MTPAPTVDTPPGEAGPVASRAPWCTCTACPLVCEDILVADGRFERACDAGRTQLAAGDGAVAPIGAADRRRADTAATLATAARLLSGARRVLVTGFGGVTLEAATRAGDLAERLAAAVDAGAAETDRVAGPTIARVGEVSADWEELRDRADLVIFWLCDPGRSHPRFVERFVLPEPVDGGPRRAILVGPAWANPPTVPHELLPLAADAGVEAARCLDTLLGGRRLPEAFPPSDAAPAAVATRLFEAIGAARCVAIVTAHDDPTGLAAWSMVHLVRTIAHLRPAFEIPLEPGGLRDPRSACAENPRPAGDAVAGAVCSWRYGASGAIDRADRAGGRFLPGEASARRLVERGEVDAVVIAGRATPEVAAALDAAAGRIAIVRIDDLAPIGEPAPHAIHLRCASLVAETSGMILRGDGRGVVLAPARQPSQPSLAEFLADLLAAVRSAEAGQGVDLSDARPGRAPAGGSPS